MSLDVYLYTESAEEAVYHSNITHNLNKMASEAGVYKALWRPEEVGITKAQQLIEPLTAAATTLVTNKSKFEKFDATNGWGTWENLVIFVAGYLQACKDYPDARVEVSR